ncbi:MAG: hypothetical protein U0793_07810 [Gemmataceae bacterium]
MTSNRDANSNNGHANGRLRQRGDFANGDFASGDVDALPRLREWLDSLTGVLQTQGPEP